MHWSSVLAPKKTLARRGLAMFLETIEAEGLAHLSYVLGDEEAGVCAVIDPRRDIGVYLAVARRHQARIAGVLETHIHADFVSGSRELAARTGAPIYVGAASEYGFPHRALRGGESIALGRLSLRVLATPGHTPEHVCYLVAGGAGAAEPWGVFTGDTLLPGEVGRPEPATTDAERLARQLHHTLHQVLLPLGDGVVVYPGHARGAAGGASTGERRTTTIGYERRHNTWLGVATESEFAAAVLAAAEPPSSRHARLKALNARGPRVVGHLPEIPPLDPDRLRERVEAGDVVVVDVREAEAYGGAHIAGSLNLPLRPAFAVRAAWMLDPAREILLVPGRPADIATVRHHLFRIGHDAVCGYLRGGMLRWIEAGLPFRSTPQISVHELRERIEDGEGRFQLLDVRNTRDWARDHLPSAQHIHLPDLAGRLDALDRGRAVVVYGGADDHASIAAGVLERGGFQRIRVVPGGIVAWRAAGYPVARGEAE